MPTMFLTEATAKRAKEHILAVATELDPQRFDISESGLTIMSIELNRSVAIIKEKTRSYSYTKRSGLDKLYIRAGESWGGTQGETYKMYHETKAHTFKAGYEAIAKFITEYVDYMLERRRYHAEVAEALRMAKAVRESLNIDKAHELKVIATTSGKEPRIAFRFSVATEDAQAVVDALEHIKIYSA